MENYFIMHMKEQMIREKEEAETIQRPGSNYPDSNSIREFFLVKDGLIKNASTSRMK